MSYRYFSIKINWKTFYKVADSSNWKILWYTDKNWWSVKWNTESDVKNNLNSSDSWWLDESDFWNNPNKTITNRHLNSWQQDENWTVNKPLLQIRYSDWTEDKLTFDNPNDYISKLNWIKNNWWTWSIDKNISEFNSANNYLEYVNKKNFEDKKNISVEEKKLENNKNFSNEEKISVSKNLNNQKITDYLKNPKTWEIRFTTSADERLKLIREWWLSPSTIEYVGKDELDSFDNLKKEELRSEWTKVNQELLNNPALQNQLIEEWKLIFKDWYDWELNFLDREKNWV